MLRAEPYHWRTLMLLLRDREHSTLLRRFIEALTAELVVHGTTVIDAPISDFFMYGEILLQVEEIELTPATTAYFLFWQALHTSYVVTKFVFYTQLWYCGARVTATVCSRHRRQFHRRSRRHRHPHPGQWAAQAVHHRRPEYQAAQAQAG